MSLLWLLSQLPQAQGVLKMARFLMLVLPRHASLLAEREARQAHTHPLVLLITCPHCAGQATLDFLGSPD